jgi:hypothetical protein
MFTIGLICHIVCYTRPRLHALGWRRGIWQLVSIVCEAVRFYDGTFFERRKRMRGQFENFPNLNGPIHVVRRETGEDVHG